MSPNQATQQKVQKVYEMSHFVKLLSLDEIFLGQNANQNYQFSYMSFAIDTVLRFNKRVTDWFFQ